MDEAKDLFDILAQEIINLAELDAKLEKRIAKLKADHAAETTVSREEIADMEKVLSDFILGNRDLFKDPRKIKTDFGRFGLQAVSEIDIKDEFVALKAVIKRNFEDCFETDTKLVKAGLKTRIESGEKIPGIVQRSGDTAVYKVTKALLDRAKSSAGGSASGGENSES
jgi:hypothetical protein